MKYALALSVMPVFVACDKDDDELVKSDDPVFVGGMDAGSDTRTALDTDSYTEGDPKMWFRWTTGDYIIVYDGTAAYRSSNAVLTDGGKRAKFNISSNLKTDAGTEYKIFYGADNTFDKNNNVYKVYGIIENQTQSEADNSDHINFDRRGDCGFATATAEDMSFSLRHLACYFMIRLTKSAAETGVVKVSKVRMTTNPNAIISGRSAYLWIDAATGTLLPEASGEGRYFHGGGRYNYVELTIADPIEVSATDPHYAYMVSAPIDAYSEDEKKYGLKNVRFDITYTVDDGAEQTKTITRTPAALVSGKVYRLSVEL